MKTANANETAAVPRRSLLTVAMAAPALLSGASLSAAQEGAQSLPSWNDGPTKQAILDFLRATTDQSSRSFVRPDDRIATFDQDGTLWVEHPVYGPAGGLPDTHVGTFSQPLLDEALASGVGNEIGDVAD
jgi:hypothetical protein